MAANDDRSVGTLPTPGPVEQKARFFREVASAFEFLSLYYSLSAADQEKLMATVQGFAAARVRSN